jgi:hypothetical protein
MIGAMNSGNLTAKQLGVLLDHAKRERHYLDCLTGRMSQKHFPLDDPLFRQAEAARAAMGDLRQALLGLAFVAAVRARTDRLRRNLSTDFGFPKFHRSLVEENCHTAHDGYFSHDFLHLINSVPLPGAASFAGHAGSSRRWRS